jgi:hypothetical protein
MRSKGRFGGYEAGRGTIVPFFGQKSRAGQEKSGGDFGMIFAIRGVEGEKE